MSHGPKWRNQLSVHCRQMETQNFVKKNSAQMHPNCLLILQKEIAKMQAANARLMSHFDWETPFWQWKSSLNCSAFCFLWMHFAWQPRTQNHFCHVWAIFLSQSRVEHLGNGGELLKKKNVIELPTVKMFAFAGNSMLAWKCSDLELAILIQQISNAQWFFMPNFLFWFAIHWNLPVPHDKPFFRNVITWQPKMSVENCLQWWQFWSIHFWIKL